MSSIKIQNIHCYHFDMPLAKPFWVRGHEISRREGLVVHVISSDGSMGFGEISPLPGISVESYSKAFHQAKCLLKDLKGASMPDRLPFLLDWFSKRLSEDVICSSTKFGFESAFLSLLAASCQKNMCELFDMDLFFPIASAGLLQGSMDDLSRQARWLYSKGYKTFKLKVGSRNIAQDVQKIEHVRRIIGPECLIRLDANRALRLDEAVLFMEQAGKDRIEYLEEPLSHPMQLESFVRKTDMPVALDETLAQEGLEDMAGRLGVTHVVARPMLKGGVAGFLDLLEQAGRLGVKVVVASSFESGIGLTNLSNLAALTPTTANFGTANWFEDDLLLRPLVADGGVVQPERLTFAPEFFSRVFSSQLRAV